MPDYYVFEYSNTSIFNTKSYELLESSIISSGNSTAIIVNTNQDSENLKTFLKKSIKKKEITINCFSVNQFIDAHYYYNFTQHLSNIDTYFKLYLSTFKHSEIYNLLYSSSQLRQEFLNSFFKNKQENITQLELELNTSTTIKSDCIKLSKNFDQFLNKNFNFSSKNFYSTQNQQPILHKIEHLFFINPLLSYVAQQHHLENLTTNYTSQTWILNKSNKTCINWIKSKIKNNTHITESQDQKLIFQINQHKTLQEEIDSCINNLKTELTKSDKVPISIIIPNNHAYKENLELKLNQHNIDFKLHYKNQKSITLLKHFFISVIQFISKEFSIDSLYDLSSNPLCKQIQKDNNVLLFDIHSLKLIKQKNIEELHNYDPKITLDTLFEFIKSNTLLNKSKRETLELIYKTQKEFHKILYHQINSENWFIEFQQFLTQFTAFNSHLDSKTQNKHDIKKLLEIIGTSLTFIHNNQNLKVSKTTIFDLLIEKINNYNPQNLTYKTAVEIFQINQAKYKQHNTCYLLGFNNRLYPTPNNSSVFDSVFLKNKLDTKVPTELYQNELLYDLNVLSKTLKISMATSINNEIQLPSLQANTSLKKVSTKKLNPSKKINNPLEKIGTKITPNINLTNLSATQLDIYNQCPYKFWLEHMLKLDCVSTESYEIPASSWGIFIHNILNSFNLWILKNTTTSKQNALKKLKEITNQKFSELKSPNLFWITKYKNLQNANNSPSILETIIDIYFSNDLLKTLYKTEKKYTKTLNKTTIKGTIDAIFETPFGPVVVDYKTGKTLASSKDIELLRSLQIPIYFYCLHNNNSKLAQAAIYFQINSQEKTAIHLKACTKEIKTEYLNKSKQRPFIYDDAFLKKIENKIATLNNLINNSYFSPNYKQELHETYKNRQKICQYCSYKIACRYKKRMAL